MAALTCTESVVIDARKAAHVTLHNSQTGGVKNSNEKLVCCVISGATSLCGSGVQFAAAESGVAESHVSASESPTRRTAWGSSHTSATSTQQPCRRQLANVMTSDTVDRQQCRRSHLCLFKNGVGDDVIKAVVRCIPY